MKADPTPTQRLARMRQSFNKDYSILTADYEYFRRHPTNLLALADPSGGASLPSRVDRPSAARFAPRSRGRSETKSSGRTAG